VLGLSDSYRFKQDAAKVAPATFNQAVTGSIPVGLTNNIKGLGGFGGKGCLWLVRILSARGG